MATATASKVIQQIRKLAAAEDRSHQPDRQLLERFVDRQEESAFQGLVRRHGPLVLGVCRRVLRHEQDAEDAFQATFLILARKAASIGKKDSLGGWLYKVAYHAAIKARAGSRHTPCAQASGTRSVPATRDPLDDLTARELLAVLDQELQRLPERLRIPLIHCYLQGQTRDHAARQLGWSLSTLQRRLEQGRERLRDRLERRGVALSMGLLVAGVTQSASATALPTLLVSNTVKAATLVVTGQVVAAGTISAPALALADGVLRSLFTAKLKIAVLALLATGLIGVSVTAIAQQVSAERQGAEKPSRSPNQSQPKQYAVLPADPKDKGPDQEKTTITGRVLGSNGKPVPGADVTVVALASQPLRSLDQGPWARPKLANTKADGEGRFRLQLAAIARKPIWSVFVLAGGTGYALGCHRLDADSRRAEIEFRLSLEQVVRGRLVDLQGQAAAGVRVQPLEFSEESDEHRWLAYIGGALRLHSVDIACWPKAVLTNAQGAFALHGLPPKCTVTIKVEHDRFAPQELEIRPKDGREKEEFTGSLAPARTIEGTVTYADTGKPVPNAHLDVMVRESQLPGVPSNSIHFAESRADERGRFRVSLPIGQFVTLSAYPTPGTPYLPLTKNLDWPKAQVIKQEMHLALPHGVLVHGIVTEAPSGKSVSGAFILYEPFRGNNPFYREDVIPQSARGRGLTATSGPEGKFEVAVLPGPGHLLVNGPTLDYLHTEITDKELYGVGIPSRHNYPDALVRLELKPDARRMMWP